MEGEVKIALAFGSWPPGLPRAETILEFTDKAEEWGFDSIWISDHIVGRPQFECLTILSVIAGRTTTLKLGTSVLVMSLRHPTVVAKALATLDYLSGGRLLLAVGSGAGDAQEFAACGVRKAERGGRTDEAIEITRRLWTESNVTYHGRYYQLENVTIEPKPARSPCPPVWVGGKSEAAMKRVARLGDGWLASYITPDGYRKGLEKIGEYAKALGREFDPDEAGVLMNVTIAENREKAQEIGIPFLPQREPLEYLLQTSAFGTAEECIKTIQGYRAVGARKFVLRPACPPDQLIVQLKVLANEVLPAFR